MGDVLYCFNTHIIKCNILHIYLNGNRLNSLFTPFLPAIESTKSFATCIAGQLMKLGRTRQRSDERGDFADHVACMLAHHAAAQDFAVAVGFR